MNDILDIKSNEFIYKEPMLNNSNDDTINIYSREILERLENQWTPSKIKIILDLMDFLLNLDINENKSSNIKSLETIIYNSDEETQKILEVK
jgi:hypothetical protein